jgi:hypothetical protein
MEVVCSIVKLGYSRDKRDAQPMLAEALMVPAREPMDAEIYRHFLMRARPRSKLRPHIGHTLVSRQACHTLGGLPRRLHAIAGRINTARERGRERIACRIPTVAGAVPLTEVADPICSHLPWPVSANSHLE